MPRKFTFDDYWAALDPADPIGLKESILRRADQDPGIDWQQFKQLVDRAYPDLH